jgi:hypothetical protein
MTFKKLSPPPDAQAALAAARLVDPTSPPVRLRVQTPEPAVEPVVGLNLRVRLSTSDAISAVAQERRVSMKVVVMHALEQAGIAVAPVDLEDRTPSRRKGH